MIALIIAVIALIALAVLIGMELDRHRTREKAAVTRRNVPRRQPQLEDRIRAAFDGPREKHGDVFVSYAIWKRDHETRMELFAGDPFAQLNEFTRSLIVRHLWRALESISEGSVVVVDSPPQTWSKAVNEKFVDHGIDPWRIAATITTTIGGPQFAKE